MEEIFDFPALRIQQPAKMLANRATYEIFSAQRQLLAVATETQSHSRLDLISKSMPGTRVLAVATGSGEPILTLTQQASEWVTDLEDPAGELVGRIRTGSTKRIYTFLDARGQTTAKATGDLALKHFSVTGSGGEFARVRKTWAGLTKETFTSADHYLVEFTGPASPSARMQTVMMPIVVDLTLYGPI